ncbi:unnamed protein product [Meganyctiphanes norvegica]|uniref:Uncharacterized protein n=1 Tax=Meganyctiphanes norvegica TaxID=48144 RepID=A0AAV2Q245_MEGNR
MSSCIMKDDIHHADGTGFGGLLMGRGGPEGGVSVGPGQPPVPGSRAAAMSALLHEHAHLSNQGRPHSPITSQHKEGGGNKRNHSPNKGTANDPLSHRIIEKRRRDRMNNCLADLSRLIPAYYTKKGRGRIEKTEIIEMAIKYMKHLKAHECQQIETCELTMEQKVPTEASQEPLRPPNQTELYHMGYQECINETMHFLNESEGLYPGDSLCVRLLNHLNKHQKDLMGGELTLSRASGASSSSSGYHANGSSTGSSSDGNGSGSAHASENKDTDITEESAYRSDDHTLPEDRDDNSNHVDASQLREILQQQSSHYLGGYDQSPDFTSGSYSQGLSSNTSSSGDDNGARLYKFKSNMKHRFTSDLETTHQIRKKRRDSESSCGNYTDYEKDCGTPTGLSCQPHNVPGKVIKRDYQNSPLLEKTPRKTIKEELIPGLHDDVPIFALNKNGSFYIPLTIDYSLIAKGMAGVIETAPVLHPVSIFVNFSVPSSSSCAVNNGPNNSPQNFKFNNHCPSKQLPNISGDGEVDTRFPEHPQDHSRDVCRDSQLLNPSYNDLKLRPGHQNLSMKDSENFDSKECDKHDNSDLCIKRLQPHIYHQSDIPCDASQKHPRESRKILEQLPLALKDLREHIPSHPSDHKLPQEPRDMRDHREQLHLQEQYDIQERHNLSQRRVSREPRQSLHEFIEKNSSSASYSRTHPNWLQHIKSTSYRE